VAVDVVQVVILRCTLNWNKKNIDKIL
jgi:hypothetical protein